MYLAENGEVIVEYRKCDEAEERQLQKFVVIVGWPGQFSSEYIQQVRSSCFELSKCVLDLVTT